MQSEMNGQGNERISGAPQSTGPEGGRDRRPRILVGAFTCAPATAPSQEIVVLPRDIEVVGIPELVADLYDPSLVISPGYVGPDRRRIDRSAPPKVGVPPWLRRVLQVVLMTVLVVVPLTMISARSVPPAATGPSSTQVQPSGKAGAVAGTAPQHGSPHVFTASSRQIARAEAAYRRALARVEATGAVVAPSTSGAIAGTGAVMPSGRTQTVQAPTSSADGQQAATAVSAAAVANAATAAAQQRAASQAQAAQKRATDQAAAIQRRALRAAARVETQAQRTAAHSGADQGTRDGSGNTGT